MARCRISSDIVRAQHQRMHPAAVPLPGSQARSRVGRYSRTAPNSAFRRHAERLHLREIRSPLSRPGWPHYYLRGLVAPSSPGWLDSLELAVAGARYSIRCCRHTLHPRSWRMANQLGLASWVKGRLGYTPQRPPAPTQAGESPWPRCWFGTRASPRRKPTRRDKSTPPCTIWRVGHFALCTLHASQRAAGVAGAHHRPLLD
jgi:hypothetical protein